MLDTEKVKEEKSKPVPEPEPGKTQIKNEFLIISFDTEDIEEVAANVMPQLNQSHSMSVL